jgi:hypothetical protein
MKKAMIAIPLLLICSLFFAQPAPNESDDVPVTGGFGNGDEYLKSTAREKQAYAVGAVNGMYNATLFGAPESGLEWFIDYTKGMSPEQMAAIITKFLNDNPGDWHNPLNLTTYKAMRQAYNKAHPSRER